MNVTYWDKFLVIRTTEQVLLTWMCTETIAAGIQTESDEPFSPLRWHAGRHFPTDKSRVYLSDVRLIALGTFERPRKTLN